MEQSAIIELLGDRPVAYHPILAKALGDVKAAIWLSQLLYWQGKGKYGDWTWKSADDFYNETALTRREQERIRGILSSKGVLEQRRAGPRGTLHYRVVIDALVRLIGSYASDSTIGASDSDSTKGEIWNGQIRRNVESEGVRFDDSSNLIPETTITETTLKTENTFAPAKKTAGAVRPQPGKSQHSPQQDGIPHSSDAHSRHEASAPKEDGSPPASGPGLKPAKPSRQPSPKDQKRTELERYFAEATQLPLPRRETKSHRASAAELWWGPLRDILDITDWDLPAAKNLVAEAISRLSTNGMTISSPKSISKTALAIFAEQKRGHSPQTTPAVAAGLRVLMRLQQETANGREG